MKVAYFDCFSGISGDMIIVALIDAGLSPDLLIQEIMQVNGRNQLNNTQLKEFNQMLSKNIGQNL